MSKFATLALIAILASPLSSKAGDQSHLVGRYTFDNSTNTHFDPKEFARLCPSTIKVTEEEVAARPESGLDAKKILWLKDAETENIIDNWHSTNSSSSIYDSNMVTSDNTTGDFINQNRTSRSHTLKTAFTTVNEITYSKSISSIFTGNKSLKCTYIRINDGNLK